MANTYGFTINVDGNSVEEMERIRLALSELGAKATEETERIGTEFQKMGEKMGESFKGLKNLFLGGLGIAAAFEGFEFLSQSKEKFEELEKQVTKVKTVIESTNFNAGFTTSGVEDQAKEIGKHIAASREDILGAQAVLLSDTGIKGKIFTETTEAVADYASFYGRSMEEAAVQIGKGLNDPVKGMNRLIRANVMFTDEQKAQIKNLEAQGKIYEAQEIILRELRKEYGGQAQAFAATDQGKVAMAKKELSEFQYELGETLSKIEVSLIPVFRELMSVIRDVFHSDAMQFFVEHIKDVVQWALKLIPIWLGYKAVMAGVYALTKAQVIVQALFTAAMEGTAAASEEATVAIEGLGVAMDTLGLGVLVAGIGLAIEGFIDMQKKINDAADAISNLSETKDKYHENVVDYEKLSKQGQAYSNLSPQGKQQFGADAYEAIRKWGDENSIKLKVDSVLSDSLKKIAADTENLKHVKDLVGWKNTEDELQSQSQRKIMAEKLNERLGTNWAVIEGNTNNIQKLTKILQDNKINPPKFAGGNNDVTDNAFATSKLAGASGGLGEAKVIHINIGTMQRIDKVEGDDIGRAAKAAVDLMIREINNLSYSQSQM